MANRNVDKGREAENAAAAVFQLHGMPHCERRTKRGGTVEVDCPCGGVGSCPCMGTGRREVPADAGDLTGMPGVVVQVKWSPYKPLAHDLARTDEQRRVAGADVGLLVRKRKGVGCARAGEWDAYLPAWQLAHLFTSACTGDRQWPDQDPPAPTATWHTDLATAAQLIAHAGYGTPQHTARETETCTR